MLIASMLPVCREREHGASITVFGLVWFRTKCGNHHPNAVTTIVAPGATESRCNSVANSGDSTQLWQI